MDKKELVKEAESFLNEVSSSDSADMTSDEYFWSEIKPTLKREIGKLELKRDNFSVDSKFIEDIGKNGVCTVKFNCTVGERYEPCEAVFRSSDHMADDTVYYISISARLSRIETYSTTSRYIFNPRKDIAGIVNKFNELLDD